MGLRIKLNSVMVDNQGVLDAWLDTETVMSTISAVFVVLAAGFVAYTLAAMLRSREADSSHRQHRDAWASPTRPVRLRVPRRS